MHKKISTLLITLLVLLNILIIPIGKADAQTLSDLTVKANISEQKNFKGEIELFVKDSTGTKRVFSLNDYNNFSCTHSLPVGRCALQEIKIFDNIGEDKNREPISLPYDYDGKLNVVENENSVFTINIYNSKTDDNEEIEEPEKEKESNKNNDDINDSKPSKSNTYKSLSKIDLFVDIVLIIGIGSVVLYLKNKDRK